MLAYALGCVGLAKCKRLLKLSLVAGYLSYPRGLGSVAEGGVHWPPYFVCSLIGNVSRAFDCFGLPDDNIDRKGAASKRRVPGIKTISDR